MSTGRSITPLPSRDPRSPLSRAERRRRSVAAARRKYWRRQADAFLALGLTTRGTPRKYRQHHLFNHLSEPHKRQLRQRYNRGKLTGNGFTIRGRDRWTVTERNWQKFRSTLTLPTPVIWS
jgi:hypothetical protein